MKSPLHSLFAALTCIALLAISAAADDSVEILADQIYGHKDGLAMTLDVYKPKQNANGAGVLFMVSGGWYSTWAPAEQTLPLFKPLLDKGFTVFSVRHGSSPRYVVPEAVEDVRRGARFIHLNAEKYGVDPKRLGVYGGSAGGHLALMLGTASDEGDPNSKDEVLRASDRLACVVSIFPPTDLRDWVANPPDNIKPFPALKFDVAKAAGCSPLLFVSPDDPPTLLIHGDKDDLVPISHSQNILAEFQKQNVTSELLVIEGGGHGFGPKDNQRTVEAMVAWFEKHLAKK